VAIPAGLRALRRLPLSKTKVIADGPSILREPQVSMASTARFALLRALPPASRSSQQGALVTAN